jgi:hypothetical protein
LSPLAAVLNIAKQYMSCGSKKPNLRNTFSSLERFISGYLHAMSPASSSLFSFFKRIKKQTESSIITEVKKTNDSKNDVNVVTSEAAVCQTNCKDCLKPGCCLSCIHHDDVQLLHSRGEFTDYLEIIRVYGCLDNYSKAVDQVSIWCSVDFQKLQLKQAPTPGVRVQRRKFKRNQACYPDGQPCKDWQCCYGKNSITGETVRLG